MVEDYPSDVGSEAAEIIPMQTMNNPLPLQNPSNPPPFYNEYHPSNPMHYPPLPPPSNPSYSHHYPLPPVHLPPLAPLQYPPPHPQIIPHQNTLHPIRIPNYAHNISDPVTIVCPCCKEMVVTEVIRSSGKATYVSALLLCAINPLIAFIPFCAKKKCKDVRHYCPNCGMKVGKKKGEFCGE